MSKGGLFRNRYRNDTTRWQKWDYGASWAYFITICTKNRVNYFGSISVGAQNIVNDAETCGVVGTQYFASLRMTEIGKQALGCWQEIPVHFPFVELDEFVVMPNHVHGIVWIMESQKNDWQPNKFGMQSKNIPSIIRGYKIGVTKYARNAGIEFEWQSRYYDHVIRNEFELHRIRLYIRNNPKKWLDDRLFTEQV